MISFINDAAFTLEGSDHFGHIDFGSLYDPSLVTDRWAVAILEGK